MERYARIDGSKNTQSSLWQVIGKINFCYFDQWEVYCLDRVSILKLRKQLTRKDDTISVMLMIRF